MDFSLTDEQKLLRDSVSKYVDQHCSVERHRRLMHTELGFDPDAWRDFAELGWLCLPFSEEQGGLGGSVTDNMVLGEAMGRGLVREPFLATVVICGSILRMGGSQSQQARHLPQLMDGTRQWAFAFAEATGSYDMSRIDTLAQRSGAGYVITGQKIAVLNGHCADEFIVTARLQDQGPLALFIVAATLPGVRREAFTAVDGGRGALLCLDEVSLDAGCLLATPDHAPAVLESVVDYTSVFIGAEALGATSRLLDTTVEYARTREQFGQAISKFQALAHRMADMYLKIEELRSLLYDAAIQLESGAPEASAACSALKVKVAEAGRLVAHEAVQIHGGIGMSDELVVGHLLKRLLLLSQLFGGEDYHLQRFARLRHSAAA